MSTINWCVWAEMPGRPGYFDCLHCKLPLGHPRGQRGPREYPGNVRRRCTGAPADHGTLVLEVPSRPSGVIARAKQYKSAREKWIEAGRPVRTAGDMAAIFAVCQACPSGEYKPLPVVDGGTCDACGCGIAKERKLANKIAWSTEKCPRGHWPAAALANIEPPTTT